jgi:hypothetical protein
MRWSAGRHPSPHHLGASATDSVKGVAVGLRNKLRHLERAAEKKMIVIPQLNGTVRRFPASASRDAYLNLMDRMGAGKDAPPEHPLLKAARNSSDTRWAQSVYAEDPDEWVQPAPDLSE